MDPSNYRSFYAAIQNSPRVPELNPATGFLYGRRPVLDPEGDGARVSTNFATYTYPPGDYFSPVARGSLYPGAPSKVQGGYATFDSRDDETFWHDVESNNAGTVFAPRACSDTCTMGGCRDPTSHAYAGCVRAGCCVTARDLPPVTPPVLNSQQVYVETNCGGGGGGAPLPEFCASDLDYFNCHPWSVQTPATDPRCNLTRRHGM